MTRNRRVSKARPAPETGDAEEYGFEFLERHDPRRIYRAGLAYLAERLPEVERERTIAENKICEGDNILVPTLPRRLFEEIRDAAADLLIIHEALLRHSWQSASKCIGCGKNISNAAGARKYCPACKKTVAQRDRKVLQRRRESFWRARTKPATQRFVWEAPPRGDKQ